jgi:hypothetical protein
VRERERRGEREREERGKRVEGEREKGDMITVLPWS